ncbi:MAG: hypothetical protein ACJAYU_000075 [Bradymonadia bacterium]|jgi:hypothetical protein
MNFFAAGSISQRHQRQAVREPQLAPSICSLQSQGKGAMTQVDEQIGRVLPERVERE